MDTASASIGIILMLLFVGPVAYIIWQQSAKNKKRLQYLKTAEKQLGLNFDQTELTPSLLLGLDSAEKKLVVINTLQNFNQQIIDLKSIQRSTVKKVAGDDSTGNKQENFKYVSLELMNGSPGKNTSIVFFDEEQETGHDIETQFSLAGKWDGFIKPCLKL